jgi:phosphoglycolate phosphatase
MRPRSISRAMPSIMRAAEEIYQETCPDLRRKVCPGVRRFLSRVSKSGVVAGLVTGNLPSIGWRKMERAGLRSHFRFGAFAGQGPTRTALVKVALKQAKTEGWLRHNPPVLLIGDHPNDVNAAKANRVRSVAVATGVVGRNELAQHAPDFLVDELGQLALDELFS